MKNNLTRVAFALCTTLWFFSCEKSDVATTKETPQTKTQQKASAPTSASALASCGTVYAPVSYTHLDVYKRQPLPRWQKQRVWRHMPAPLKYV